MLFFTAGLREAAQNWSAENSAKNAEELAHGNLYRASLRKTQRSWHTEILIEMAYVESTVPPYVKRRDAWKETTAKKREN
jgi:hypothetical protein